MSASDWSSHPTLGGVPLTSWVGRRVVATDHCVALIRRCTQCYESFIVRREHVADAIPETCERCR